MYKDIDRQREANREAQRRFKARQQGITERVLPNQQEVIPGSKGITLKRELAKRYPALTVMERLFYRPADRLRPGEHNFVSLPGRACYGVYE